MDKYRYSDMVLSVKHWPLLALAVQLLLLASLLPQCSGGPHLLQKHTTASGVPIHFHKHLTVVTNSGGPVQIPEHPTVATNSLVPILFPEHPTNATSSEEIDTRISIAYRRCPCSNCISGCWRPTTRSYSYLGLRGRFNKSTTTAAPTPVSKTDLPPSPVPTTPNPPMIYFPTPPTSGPSTTNGPICEGGKYNYYEVIHKSLLFYEAQRSGPLPAGKRVTWRMDSALGDAKDSDTNTQIDLTGGYYNAGDHVKFGFPMAASITVLVWGAITYSAAYEQSGEMSYMKEAVKWATDYFIKAHPEANVFYGQVGSVHVDHAWWGRPEDMTMERPAYKITTDKPGSDLAGETAAALAAASILFADSDSAYSTKCLQHARELYAFADKYRGNYSDSITDAASFYKSWSGYRDELAWSAAWMYYATKESNYLSAAESHYSTLTAPVIEFSWDDKTAGVRALLAQVTGKSKYRSAIKEFCDLYLSKHRTPKGLTWHSPWGPLCYTANAAFVCLLAADMGIKTEEYYDYAQSQIHYMLGDTGRSFVVGYGINPPQSPHHRASSCPAKPATCDWAQYHASEPNPNVLVGALIGGPAQNDSYSDRRDYISNEVTTDCNAAFQGAVAALANNVCGYGVF